MDRRHRLRGVSTPSRTVARALLLLACSVLLCLFAQSDPSFLDHATNADALFPAAYFADVRHHGDAWHGFQLPRIPSLVPDMIVYGGLSTLLEEPRWTILAFALVQGLTTAILAGAVIAKMAGVRMLDGALAFVALLTVASAANFGEAKIKHLFAIYLPVEHFGSFVMSLAGVLVTLRLLERWSVPFAVLLTSCVAAAYVSNPKYLIDFVAPVAAASLSLAWTGRSTWQRVAATTALVSAGVAVALGSAQWLAHPQLDTELADVPVHLRRFFTEIPEYLASRPLGASVAIGIPYLTMFVASASFVRRYRSGRLAAGDTAAIFVWTFAIAAVGASIAATSTVYSDDGSYRYMSPALYWPIIVSTATILPALRRWILPLSVAQMICAAGLIVALGGWGAFAPLVLRWQHPLTACLSERRELRGLEAGLADYWIARPATVSSNWRIQVDQVAADGAPYYWANNRYSYLRSFADEPGPPRYRFVVITKLDPERVRRRYGEPDRIAACGSDTLWIYDDSDALYRRLDPGRDAYLP